MAVLIANLTRQTAPRLRGTSDLGWVDVAVAGGGPAGLAVSIELGGAGLGHIVLERGRVGESWRSQRWDSFRLNTPVWVNRVPGDLQEGPPRRFPTAPELVAGIERLAARLPVVEGVEVHRAQPASVVTNEPRDACAPDCARRRCPPSAWLRAGSLLSENVVVPRRPRAYPRPQTPPFIRSV